MRLSAAPWSWAQSSLTSLGITIARSNQKQSLERTTAQASRRGGLCICQRLIRATPVRPSASRSSGLALRPSEPQNHARPLDCGWAPKTRTLLASCRAADDQVTGLERVELGYLIAARCVERTVAHSFAP